MVLALIHMVAATAFTQSVIQRPSCSGVIHGIVTGLDGRPANGITVEAWPLGVDIEGTD